MYNYNRLTQNINILFLLFIININNILNDYFGNILVINYFLICQVILYFKENMLFHCHHPKFVQKGLKNKTY